MQSREKNIVLFDMDNTLVSEDTMFLWERFLDQKGLISEEDKLYRIKLDNDYRHGSLNIEENFRFELEIIKRIPQECRVAWKNEFIHTIVKPKISTIGLQLIQDYKNQPNTLVLIITATLSFIAQPVAEYTKVDDLIATHEEIIHGEFTGKIQGIASLGPGKVERFDDWKRANNINSSHIIYYGDSINDVPLLSQADKAYAVDPDARLREIALKNNWEIISFK